MATRQKSAALLQSELPGIKLIGRGKVRDLYDLGEHLLIVASDRISAFDVVLPNGIPEKGKILTRLSVFWFAKLGVPHHLVTAEVEEMPKPLHRFAEQLEGRSMLVRRLEIFPIECVVRGYLAGSGWNDYQKTASISGVKLPPGLRQSERLPAPIFTPTTKAKTGHDLPMSFAEVEAAVGAAAAARLRDSSLEVFRRATEIAGQKGIILADTKFEWGRDPKAEDGAPILADEVLTPDSSRFWAAASYQTGRDNESFDKQFVRDYLNGLDWDKTPPAPELPPEVIEGTARRYREIYERITGERWS
jgi:phosphoribosylaminoimidazole-succinocarboxamide synthase